VQAPELLLQQQQQQQQMLQAALWVQVVLAVARSIVRGCVRQCILLASTVWRFCWLLLLLWSRERLLQLLLLVGAAWLAHGLLQRR
jgi:hypothetical protein